MQPAILKNAAIPPPADRKYRWRDMQVGDSFLVEAEGSEESDTVQRRLSTAGIAAGRRLGMKFTTRKVPGGVQIWRVS